MAGEWLKLECSTPDKPEVFAITSAMGWEDPDTTVGKLFRLWRWFDQQTTDGNARGVTSALLDRIVGVSGFAHAMQSVGWLVITDAGVSLPNFEKHNGATAKGRAQTAKRVSNHRGNAKTVTSTVTPPLAREEKRREEKKNTEDKAQAPAFELPDWINRQHWDVWHSTAKRKRATNAQKQMAVDKLYEWKTLGQDYAGALENAALGGNQGLFLPTTPRAGQPNKQQALEDRNKQVAQQWVKENHAYV